MILVNFLSAVSGGSLTYLNNIIPRILALDRNESFCFLLTQSNFKNLVNLHKEINKHKKKFIVVDDRYSGRKRFWLRRRIRQIILEKSITTVFTPYQVGNYFRGVTNIFMIRNMEPFLFKKYKYDIKNRIRNYLLDIMSKHSLAKADRIICVSNYSRDYVLNVLGIKKEKVSTIYHGRDNTFTNIESSQEDLKILNKNSLSSRSYLFTAGSFLPYRRLEDILRAINKLQINTSVKLVVAGDGNDQTYKRKIKRIIKKYDLESSVILLGHIGKRQIQVLYRHSLMFLTATEIEACPNIAIESSSSGCVVISSDTTPLKEIYRDSALYFKKRNISKLAEQIEKLLNNEKARDDLSARALSNSARFSWDKCAEETFNILVNNNKNGLYKSETSV